MGVLEYLADLQAGLHSLVAEAAQEAAPEVLAAAQKDWQAGRAPDGSTWAPLKRHPGRVPLVTVTTDGSARAAPGSGEEDGSIVLTVPDILGKHQTGRPQTNLPARPLFPSGALPPAWSKPIEQAVLQRLEKAIK